MRPDILIVDGRALSWRRLCELRRAQLAAWQAEAKRQPLLFEVKEDHRPACERTVAQRYSEPCLLSFMAGRGSDR